MNQSNLNNTPAFDNPGDQNRKLVYLYYSLIETQRLLENEILPVAGYLRVADADADLVTAAEDFCAALARHLSNFKIQIARLEATESETVGK